MWSSYQFGILLPKIVMVHSRLCVWAIEDRLLQFHIIFITIALHKAELRKCERRRKSFHASESSAQARSKYMSAPKKRTQKGCAISSHSER